MQYPPIQIVNDQDEPIGSATLADIHKKGLRHRVVYVLCEDFAGNILLQKRGPDMSTYPNCWDISAAGHVDEGETYEVAAERELQEELGIRGFKLEKVKDFYSETTVEGRHLNRFCRVYKLVIPANLPLYPDPTEVTDTKWMTLDKIKQQGAAHPERFALGVHQILLA